MTDTQRPRSLDYNVREIGLNGSTQNVRNNERG